MAAIQIKGAVKHFKDGTIDLSNFNIEIADGEFIVLAGLKGSGKTTVSNIIAGLDSIQSGDILFDGRRVNDVPPEKRKVGLVLRHQTLYPHMTVFENFSLSLRLCETPMNQIAEKINRMAKKLEIEELLLKRPDELSEEQILRVLIGRAAIREPQVLIIDHPFASKEPKRRLGYSDTLQEIHAKLKLTTIMTTEDRYLVKNFSGRVVILNSGYIQQSGEASYIYDHPDSLFVASFLTVPQLSTCSGVLRLENGEYSLEIGQQKIVLTSKKDKLKKYIDKEVLVGIRPQAVQIMEEAGNYFVGTVEHVENTLYGEMVTITGPDCSVTAPNVMKAFEGEEITFTLSKEQILLFDKETEKIIL